MFKFIHDLIQTYTPHEQREEDKELSRDEKVQISWIFFMSFAFAGSIILFLIHHNYFITIHSLLLIIVQHPILVVFNSLLFLFVAFLLGFIIMILSSLFGSLLIRNYGTVHFRSVSALIGPLIPICIYLFSIF